MIRFFVGDFLLLLDFFPHLIYLILHVSYSLFTVPICLILNSLSFYLISIVVIFVLNAINFLVQIHPTIFSSILVAIALLGVIFNRRTGSITGLFSTLVTKLNLKLHWLFNKSIVVGFYALLLLLHAHLYLIDFAFQLVLHRIILLLVIQLLLLNMGTQLRIIELLIHLILQMLYLIQIHFFLFRVHILDFGR